MQQCRLHGFPHDVTISITTNLCRRLLKEFLYLRIGGIRLTTSSPYKINETLPLMVTFDGYFVILMVTFNGYFLFLMVTSPKTNLVIV